MVKKLVHLSKTMIASITNLTKPMVNLYHALENRVSGKKNLSLWLLITNISGDSMTFNGALFKEDNDYNPILFDNNRHSLDLLKDQKANEIFIQIPVALTIKANQSPNCLQPLLALVSLISTQSFNCKVYFQLINFNKIIGSHPFRIASRSSTGDLNPTIKLNLKLNSINSIIHRFKLAWLPFQNQAEANLLKTINSTRQSSSAKLVYLYIYQLPIIQGEIIQFIKSIEKIFNNNKETKAKIYLTALSRPSDHSQQLSLLTNPIVNKNDLQSLKHELAAVSAPLRPTELLGPWANKLKICSRNAYFITGLCTLSSLIAIHLSHNDYRQSNALIHLSLESIRQSSSNSFKPSGLLQSADSLVKAEPMLHLLPASFQLRKIIKQWLNLQFQQRLFPKINELLSQKLWQTELDLPELYAGLRAYHSLSYNSPYSSQNLINYYCYHLSKQQSVHDDITTCTTIGQVLQPYSSAISNLTLDKLKYRYLTAPPADWLLALLEFKSALNLNQEFTPIILNSVTNHAELFDQRSAANIPLIYSKSFAEADLDRIVKPLINEINQDLTYLDSNRHLLSDSPHKLAVEFSYRYQRQVNHYWLSFAQRLKLQPCLQLECLRHQLTELSQDISALDTLINELRLAAPSFIQTNLIPSEKATAEFKTKANALLDSIRAIEQSNNPPASAFKELKELALNSLARGTIDSSTPKWLIDWHNQLKLSLILSLAKLTNDYINLLWQDKILAYYLHSIDNHLTGTAERNLSINDFKLLFAPKGLLDAFYIKYIAPFMRPNPLASRIKGSQPIIPWDSTSLNFWKQFLEIKSTYFNSKGEPEYQLNLQPFSLDAKLQRADLYNGSQHYRYQHGPQFNLSLKWPDQSLRNLSKISVTDFYHRTYTLSAQGPWSIFELIAKAAIEANPTNNQVRLNYKFSNKLLSFSLDSAAYHSLSLLSGLNLPDTFDLEPVISPTDKIRSSQDAKQ